MLDFIKSKSYSELYEQTAIHASMAIDTGAYESFWSKMIDKDFHKEFVLSFMVYEPEFKDPCYDNKLLLL